MLISERSSLRNAIRSMCCATFSRFDFVRCFVLGLLLPPRFEWPTNWLRPFETSASSADSSGWPLLCLADDECLDGFLVECLPEEDVRCRVWLRYRWSAPRSSARSPSVFSVWPSSWRLWWCAFWWAFWCECWWTMSGWTFGWSVSKRPLNSQLIFLTAGLA